MSGTAALGISLLIVLLTSSARLLLEVGASPHEIFGCGGFVRAPNALTSQVSREVVAHALGQLQVQLKTTDGLFKDITECSPNGYFFVPLYDEGSYRLELEAPEGWTFKPQSAPCLKGGADVEFELIGFTITGLVETSGCPVDNEQAGLKDVEVTLYEAASSSSTKSNSAPLQRTRTNALGQFRFEGIPSGVEYSIRARHMTEQWSFVNEATSLVLPWGNVELPSPFIVSGFAVSGYVYASAAGNDGGAGVAVSLYPAATDPATATALQTAVTSANGYYQFLNVGCGSYILVARLLATDKVTDGSRFSIAPERQPLSVGRHSVEVNQAFRIMGFSIDGQVLHSDGTPVEGAQIVVKDHHYHQTHPAITDSEGRYQLTQMKVGRFHISASKDRFAFSPLSDLAITLDSFVLPPLRVTGVDVCGTLNLAIKPAGDLTSRSIEFRSADDTELVVATITASASDAHNFNFCALLPSGRFIAKPVVSASELKAGLAFLPDEVPVTVQHSPVLGLSFTQVLHSISVSVDCLEQPCSPAVSVQLTNQATATRESLHVSGDGRLTFVNVLPGTYSVQIAHAQNHYCWESTQSTVRLPGTPAQPSTVSFKQTGFRLIVQGATQGDYTLTSNLLGSSAEPLLIHNGRGEYCVDKAGAHELTPKGCFRFQEASYTWNTANPQILRVASTHVLAEGRVEVDSSAASLFNHRLASVSAVNLDNKQVTKLELHPVSEATPNVFAYSLWLAPGSVRYTLSVDLSGLPALLSYPETGVTVRSPTKIDECPLSIASLGVREGRFLIGSMDPPIAGVLLDVQELLPNGEHRHVYTVETDGEGAYRAGPFYDGHEYQLSPSKEGFEFRQQADGLFYARKLGSISVLVRDIATQQPVAGVLVSLSDSHSYRNNSVTNADGVFVFGDLFPGEFYLRPLLKEYTFEPSTVSLQIREGTRESYEIRATRVAWSCYGSVTSLGQTASSGVEIRAEHPAHSEETRTDASGAFRLRGLKPGYTYTVAPVIKGASALSRSLPASRSIDISATEPAEVRDVNFLAFVPNQLFDVVGTVAADDEHAKELRVVLLHRSGGQETEIANHSVALSRDFVFVGLDQRQTYTVHLEYTPENTYYVRKTNASDDVVLSKETRSLVVVPLYFSTRIQDENNFEIDYASLVIAVLLIGGGLGAQHRRTVRHQINKFIYHAKQTVRGQSHKTTPRPPQEAPDDLAFLPKHLRDQHIQTRNRGSTPKR